ncbi:hypothetical protein [Roseibium sp. RKSG952]|uniref:hypothetical protein n=1 Tax=Roseibium sp. RKSG952 TaxID=2529384 RepID=UPI0012BC082A|nr:hypothetical protein [Roseibium sp. RKSG952]MTH95019.1 hypothetical protein [Roseibium sp. RKSG952]
MDLKNIVARAAFADIEASGLMEDGFPVEVAWRMRESKGSILVKPCEFWNIEAWDADAERIHGLDRDHLVDAGTAVSDVATALNDVFSAKMVYTDSPEQDAAWFDMIHAAADVPRRYRVISISRILAKMGFDAESADPLFAAARLKCDPRGRAANGVTYLSAVFSLAVKERTA